MIVYIVYFLFSVIMGFVLLLASVFNHKIRTNYYNSYKQLFQLKKILRDVKNSNKQVLIFHAASVGEYEQIKPILRGVDGTKFFIVQTFTSPSIYNVETNDEGLYDMKCYHPLDIFWLSYLFFRIIHPNKYIITRHDLWPGHILMANYFKIPIYYINANIHKNSIWYKKSFRFLSRFFLNKINRFVVPSKYISENLHEILPTAVSVIMQDTRFNQTVYLKNRSKNYQFINQENPSRNQVITFGSIDEMDEKIIYKILPTLCKIKKIILVPHEVGRKTIHRIEDNLDKLSISYSKFSKTAIDFSKNIILVDELGLLAHLYALGSHAYVGGGFKRGVHSVLEPAVHGCLIACGPNIEMLDEAKLLKEEGYLTIINNRLNLETFSHQSGDGPDFMHNLSSVATDMVELLLPSVSENSGIPIES